MEKKNLSEFECLVLQLLSVTSTALINWTSLKKCSGCGLLALRLMAQLL